MGVTNERFASCEASFENRTADGRIGVLNIEAGWISEIIVGVNPAREVCELLNLQWSTLDDARLRQLKLRSYDYGVDIVARLDPGAIQRPRSLPLARSIGPDGGDAGRTA
jgi:hypothetical protein